MTQKLTKKILVKLIKEEIIKSQLLNEITDEELSKLGFNAREIRKLQNSLTSGVPSLVSSANRRIQAKRATGAGVLQRVDRSTIGKMSDAELRALGFSDREVRKLQNSLAQRPTNPIRKAAVRKIRAKQAAAAKPAAAAPAAAAPAAAAGSEPGFFDEPGLFGKAAQDVQKQFNLAMLRAKGDIDVDPETGLTPDQRKRIKSPKKRRRSRGPYFFRKYRKAGIDKAFAKEFGGTDKTAFDNFYARVNMPEKARDYQFGPGHYRKFTAIMGKDRAEVPGTKASKSSQAPSDLNQILNVVTRRYQGPYKASITIGDMKRTARKALADLKRRVADNPKLARQVAGFSVDDMEIIIKGDRARGS